ncbi:hypothetical protein [Naasia aerilata]|nr:hypothetical protein [Naasia aerilata]
MTAEPSPPGLVRVWLQLLGAAVAWGGLTGAAAFTAGFPPWRGTTRT